MQMHLSTEFHCVRTINREIKHFRFDVFIFIAKKGVVKKNAGQLFVVQQQVATILPSHQALLISVLTKLQIILNFQWK